MAPSPAGLLHRPRVCAMLERGLEGRLTLVSAPAGYGKTSALIDFSQRCPAPVCWYTADERDRDLGVFVEYLVGAIAECFPGFGTHTRSVLSTLASDLVRDPAAAAGALVNEILEVAAPFVIVVDNFETVEGALGIRAFIGQLPEILPANCHLMLGSRALPSVPITRLVATRQLVGLTASELRFSPEEIRELLQRSGIEVADSEIQAIATNSEGWITGVLLLVDRLRDQAGTSILDTARATADTYDYLAAEVLGRQSRDIQHFLYTSAVLSEMSPRTCREVLHIRQPQALLAEVERRNLFVTRFGRGAAATYRYHNLFRDFLHQQLHQRDPDRYSQLHLRAAEWFERHNDVEEAVYHYVAAEVYPNATALMERVAMEWFTRGRVETLLRWADSLPEETRVQAPRLSLYQSRVLTDRNDYAGARQALAQAEAGFTDRGGSSPMAWIHTQRATLELFEGRYEEVIQHAQAALEVLDQHTPGVEAEAQRLIGRAHVGLGHLAEGIAQLQGALDLARQTGSRYDTVNLLQDLVPPLTALGRFDEAASCLNEALVLGRQLGAPTQLAGVLNNLACLHYVRGEYHEALALFEEGLATARRGGALWLQANTMVGMADQYRDAGAYDRAEPLYNAGWQIAQETDPGLAVYVLAAQSTMYRWQGNPAQALDLLALARRLAEEKGRDFEMHGLLRVEEGIARAESGETQDGLAVLSDAVRFLQDQQARQELARARFLLAKAFLLAGDERQAATELRLSLELTKDTGTDQFAVAEGQHAEDLLRLGIAEGLEACRALLERGRALRDYSEQLAHQEDLTEGQEAPVDRLEIYAFGEGRVVRDRHVVSSSDWQAAMSKEMFFYILLHGPVERGAIGLVFWPDVPTKRMVDSFHSTLYRIRGALGPESVVVDENQYRVGEVSYWFDVDEFQDLVQRARLLPPHDWQAENLWRRAVALYTGDFLPEVDRPWAVPKREELRDMYLEALSQLGRCHEARSDFDQAINWYRRALEVDALREDLHRRIMSSYAATGRRSEALAQYRRCQQTLEDELGIEPSLQTKEIYEQIAGKTPD